MNGFPQFQIPGLNLGGMINNNQLMIRDFSSPLNQGTGAGQSGFGFNLPTAQLGMSLLGGLGGLWGANQMNRLARDQFNFTKEMSQANLRNQTQSYNTALEDRIRSRMVAEGRPESDGNAYLDRNRLR